MSENGEAEQKQLIDEQNREKVRNDFATTFWVEAGAGTGKTRLLIERLFNTVTTRKVPLEQIVAITFTEKAAAEIKVRLRDKLESMRQQDISPDIDLLIARALEEVEHAPIMTIHSFAARILRERPIEAGVDPQFEILDAESTESLMEEVWERWFLGEVSSQSEPLRRLIKLGFTQSSLQNLGWKLHQQRDVVAESSYSVPPDFSPEDFMKKLEEHYEELSSLIVTCQDENDQGYLQFNKFKRWIDSTSGLPEEDLCYSILYFMPEIKGNKGNKKNWSPPENCTRQKDICKSIQELQNQMVKIIEGKILQEAIEWLRGFSQAIETKKNELGSLEFGDLLLQCRNLLRDNWEVRSYFQNRYSQLLVDEFQDTDPLQAEIIFFLAEKEPLTSRWREVKLEPGKLFIVGDPKQAIYRFRRADIEVYEEAKECVEKQGELLQIVQNFRTLPSIIDWVNSSFAYLMEPIPERRYQPDYEGLDPYREKSHEQEKRVTVLSFPEEVADYKAQDKRVMEARCVVSLLEEAEGNWQVEDKESGEVRPLSWGDVGILFPTTTDLEIYQRALQESSIPYHLEGGKLFFQRQEVDSFIRLLTAIDNPYDRVSVVSALKNYFGVDDEALLKFTGAGGNLNYLENISFSGEEAKSVRQAFEVLNHLHKEKETNTVTELLGKILHQVGVYSNLLLSWRGEQAVSNLEKIIEIARSLEGKEVFTLQGLIKWLQDKGGKGREESESILSEKDMEAVQLTTIHRAKGLEFNLVVLVNLMAGGSSSGEDFVTDRLAGRFEVKSTSPTMNTFGYPELNEEEKLRLEAEKRRLFYVATTRARDYLVLPYPGEGRKGSYLNYMDGLKEKGCISQEICRIIDIEEVGVVPSSGEEIDKPKGSVESGEESEGGEGSRDLWYRRKSWQENLQRVAANSSQPVPTLSAWEIMEETDVPGESEIKEDLSPNIARGAGFGSAFHSIMEKIPLTNYDEQLLIYHVQDAASYWGLDLAQQEKLKKLVEETLKSPLLDRARSSNAYREVPFAVSYEGWILEGLVDLLFSEPDGLVICDYKTDDVSGDRLEERFEKYRLQGLFYALALSQSTGWSVKEVNFYFVQASVEKRIISPELDEIKKAINESKTRDAGTGPLSHL